VTGPLTVSFVQASFGLESFFLLMAGLLFLMAAISILRVLTIPALPAEYKTTTTMQASVAAVGSVLHPEEKEVVEAPAGEVATGIVIDGTAANEASTKDVA
jgi:hypothetical protein